MKEKNLMNKNTVQWILGLPVCIVLLLGMFLSPSLRHSYEFKAIFHSTLLNAIAFVMGYSILKPLKSLIFWKYIVYVIIVTGVNWVIFSMRGYDWSLPLVGGQFSWFFLWILPYMVAILVNIGFLKYLFGIKTQKAIMMGVLLGITNAQSMIVNFPIQSYPDTVL